MHAVEIGEKPGSSIPSKYGHNPWGFVMSKSAHTVSAVVFLLIGPYLTSHPIYAVCTGAGVALRWLIRTLALKRRVILALEHS